MSLGGPDGDEPDPCSDHCHSQYKRDEPHSFTSRSLFVHPFEMPNTCSPETLENARPEISSGHATVLRRLDRNPRRYSEADSPSPPDWAPGRSEQDPMGHTVGPIGTTQIGISLIGGPCSGASEEAPVAPTDAAHTIAKVARRLTTRTRITSRYPSPEW